MPDSLTREDAALDSLVARVVDDFRDRQKRGEKPDAEEYAARHPEAAELLRKVLATFQLLDGSLPDESATDDAPLSGTLGDFRLIREVGRGGMGIVYEAEQILLGRRVALKVLPFAATLDPRQLQRFHNEARAAASLRHEHIVPVYAVGQERGVHFFAMQFVDGQTMADLIRQQKAGAALATDNKTTLSGKVDIPAKPAADTEPVAGKSTEPIARNAAYFRRAAEWGIQAAEALEHAHSLGIVHRDIKPGNLMIDAQGQLWVADFGLARRAADSDLTVSGDLLGTLRYMSPEQALAKHDLVDHRSDIYSLGATLYELLTLQSAVEGNDRQEILRQITQTDAKSLRHWDRRIPADLETIVLKALAKEPEVRYATAKEFADDLRRYLSHEPIRARRPTLAQRTMKCARRNRAVVTAAAAALFFVATVLGAVAGWIGNERSYRSHQVQNDVTSLLDDVDRQRGEIHARLADPTKVCELLSNIDGWRGTLVNARANWLHANNLATSNKDVLLVTLPERLRLAEEGLRADEADWTDAKQLDDFRLDVETIGDVKWAPKSAGPKYERFFLNRGLDWKTSKPAELAAKIRQSRLRYVLVAAIDDWVRPNREESAVSLLVETTRLADPDPWRDSVRDSRMWSNPDGLRKLAKEVDIARQTPHILSIVAGRLRDQKQGAAEVAFLRAGLAYYPQDFWLHYQLGIAQKNVDQQIGCFQAALALRPNSGVVHCNLAILHTDTHDLDTAILHGQKATALKPHFANAHQALGRALSRKNDLDGAIRHHGKAVELDPTFAMAHYSLGLALYKKKNLDGAIVHYRKAVALDHEFVLAHHDLGVALYEKKDFDGAMKHLKRAIDLDPDLALGYYNIGNLLNDKKDLEGAFEHYTKTVELDPSFPKAYCNLGLMLRRNKDIDGAIRHFRSAIDLDDDYALAHFSLANALRDKNDLDGAILSFRKAIELDPKSFGPHYNLALILRQRKDFDGALHHFRKGVEVNPTFANGYLGIGRTLFRIGQFAEALPYFRQGYKLGAKQPNWRPPSTDPAKDCERMMTLDKEASDLINGLIPSPAPAHWADYLLLSELKLDGIPNKSNLAKLPLEQQEVWNKKSIEYQKLRTQAQNRFHEVISFSGNANAKQRAWTHEVKLQAGKAYLIDLESRTFDTFLRLDDFHGKKLAENDDVAPGMTNSRLIFTPPTDGTYRLAASAFGASGAGPYTLTIREFVK